MAELLFTACDRCGVTVELNPPNLPSSGGALSARDDPIQGWQVLEFTCGPCWVSRRHDWTCVHCGDASYELALCCRGCGRARPGLPPYQPCSSGVPFGHGPRTRAVPRSSCRCARMGLSRLGPPRDARGACAAGGREGGHSRVTSFWVQVTLGSSSDENAFAALAAPLGASIPGVLRTPTGG